MKAEIKKKKLSGLVEIIPEVYEDERGFLARSYEKKAFQKLGLNIGWKEQSLHHTNKKYTLRGLYIQLPPYSEGKLLSVINGEMLWVSVDLRKNSKTFGQWDSLVLTGALHNLLYAPRGLAHGCVSLSDDVDLLITSDNEFAAAHGVGILWSDKDLDIDWNLGTNTPFVSARDGAYPSFQNFKENIHRNHKTRIV